MYYQKEIKEVLSELNSSKNGLTEIEARKRLEKYGKNVLEKKHEIRKLKILLGQFTSPLIIILIISTIIIFALKEFLDGIAILIIIFLNAILGFIQEYKAEKAIELLRKLNTPNSRVIRDNKEKIISSELLVPGDIILFETGDKINVDARLIEILNLNIDESVLTGESTSVDKQVSKIKNQTIVSDQNNMVFSGTLVVNGRGKAIVTSTGMDTEIGKIAKLIEKINIEETPLQKKLKKLGDSVALLAFLISVLVIMIGLFKGLNILNIFKTSISLAVAIIPEGLPAVITISLAIGVQRMLKKKALIRKLHAVETLGNVQIICTDKTGTLTKNEMTVTELFVNNKEIKVTGKGYELKGDFLFDNKKINPKEFTNLINTAVNCNNASLPDLGDPTELSLLVLGKKAKIERSKNRINEELFSSEKKYMSVTYEINKEKIKFIKGAPEVIINFCNYIEINNRLIKLNSKEKEFILKKNSELASRALRVLGLAYEKDKKTVFTGLIGMIDPPRKEVKEAIKIANDAGIRVIMITGDHKETALAIAKEIGIKGKAISGNEIDEYDINDYIDHTNIYARVSAEHKVKILEELQRRNNVVAMTGDGINDAPALKKADIGIAMNIKGTDVARDASNMILVDDNFASIVNAIKEGRVIYDNIKKFVKYLLSANFGEVLIILLSLILNLPLPLLPLQILWVNLVTDGLPALALGIDNPSENVMRKKPRNKNESILKNTFWFILSSGIISAILVLGLFYNNVSFDLDKARTIALTSLIIFELFLVFTIRGEEFMFNNRTNKYIWLAVISSIFLHLVIMYTDLNIFFKLVPLSFNEWIKILFFSFISIVIFEIVKAIKSTLQFLKSKPF
ncbi:calcium-translocating P-type ATPase, PMCA-type [Candidatus Woesearchaeota archaeon]|nr:calcium-translocating P-type ATPase, PMCA-type [Candidatus Woesearchaeota archaeon]